MFANNMDINSLLFLFMGKDNSWIPIIMLIMFISQKWSYILNMWHKLLHNGKTERVVERNVTNKSARKNIVEVVKAVYSTA